MRTRTMQTMSFHLQRWENVGTQAIHQNHWSFHLYLSKCHLLHNLHSLQKVIHRQNRETTRREYLRDVEKDDKNASNPVARHVNLPNHSKQHTTVCGLSIHRGSTESRETLEQKIFFKWALFIFTVSTLFMQLIYSVVFHVTRHQPIA